MDRVKFYSTNDIMYGFYLRNSERLIKEYEAGKEPQSINDMIEIYNIKKYLDNKIFPSEWSLDTKKHYESIIRKIFGVVGRFFSLISDDTFQMQYYEVDREYKYDFWELIEKFKVHENISFLKFQEFLGATKLRLREVLRNQRITDYFGHLIRDYMMNQSSSAELLLEKYEIKHLGEPDPIYFPKVLSNQDKEKIIINYIDSPEPNLNYMRLITNIQSNKDKLEVSPRTLLKAKRKVEDLEKQFFPKNSGFQIETTVSFSKLQEEAVVTKSEDHSISATYSTKWVRENSDNATLLNNFIYLFDFVDMQMRCTFVNKFNQMGVFERFLITSSQNAYTKGFEFEQRNILSLLQMSGYYNQLFSFGIRLEEVIEWFFKEYLSHEFDVGFSVIMPSINSTFLEKCTNIMPALESVLKQFSLFVQEGSVDFELLEIRSEHLIYKNVPSLVEKKYAYGVGDEFKATTHLLFSDQSGLGYNKKTTESYTNFFELLCNENFSLDDYPDYNIASIKWLVENDYLMIDENELVTFSNAQLILILKDLYFNEVISYWKYSNSGREIIDKLEEKNVVEFESSLFSRPEQDYINYNLNKSQFNNSLDLRNKYSHTQPANNSAEGIHNQNYLVFLRIFILAVIKINDDFCTFDMIKRTRLRKTL